MNFSDLTSDQFAMPIGEQGGNEGSTGENGTNLSGNGDTVQLSRADFESLRKGAMREDDYQARLQALNSMNNELKKSVAELSKDKAEIDKAKLAMPKSEVKEMKSEIKAENPGLNEQQIEAILDRVVQSKMKPLADAITAESVDIKVDKMINQFQVNHKELFRGNAQDNQKLLDRVILRASQGINDRPVDLETAFLLEFGNDYIKKVNQISELAEKRKKSWETEDSTNNGQTVTGVYSRKDANDAFQKNLASLRGGY
jgi:hypothetical protein